MKLRARLRQQRIVLEEVESSRDGIVGVLRVPDFGVILRSRLVMPNAGQMTHDLASRNRPRLLRKRRTILLHRSVEVELSMLPQLHGGGRGQWFRNRCEAEQGLLVGRYIVLKIR